MKQQPFFCEKLIVRTPTLPFDVYRIEVQVLKELISKWWFLEAIYLASPSLYEAALKWKKGELIEKKAKKKVVLSLAKYLARMQSRSTPFGLFAACTPTFWNNDAVGVASNIILEQPFIRKSRFDMHYLGALSDYVAQLPHIQKHLHFTPNTSLFRVAGEYRYIEYVYLNGRRSHRLTAIGSSEYVDKLLLHTTTHGATISELVSLLTDEEITPQEAEEFVLEIIDSQLLVNNLEPSLTGGDFLDQLILFIENCIQKSPIAENEALLSALNKLNAQIQILDNTSEEILAYLNLQEKLKKFPISFEESKLVQTDTFGAATEKGIPKHYQNQLLKCIPILEKLAPNIQQNSPFNAFKNAFISRFETKEVALWAVLDSEIGIGYGKTPQGEILPLIDELALPENPEQVALIQWTATQKWLFKTLQQAILDKKYEVNIDTKQLEHLGSQKLQLPPSMSVIFRVVGDKTPQLYLERFVGPSAVNLLGRFASGSEPIFQLINEVVSQEKMNNSEILFAEIIHLPDRRDGNVILHPSFLDYEIPYLSKSSVEKSFQIPLSDLYVSVQNDAVILRSKRLNKIIVPRLSSAHNFTLSSLPIYQFLCDLQYQFTQPFLEFSWGWAGEQFDFLPRVIIEDVIVSPATWKLQPSELKLLPKIFDELQIKDCLNKWQMPTEVVISEGDNELLINWENSICYAIFRSALVDGKALTVKEFLREKTTFTITSKEGRGFTNQFIAQLINPQPLPYPSIKKTELNEIQRSFGVGSEWLYFKLYCGASSADKILLEYVAPIIQKTTEENIIKKWFFIRYADPEPHIRLRVNITNITDYQSVVLKLCTSFEQAKSEGLLFDIQQATYNRELERYGAETIELAERIFHIQSFSFIQFLENSWGDNRENQSWLWGLKAVDDFLKISGLSLNEKLEFIATIRDGFAEEFGMDINLKKQLDARFRNHRNDIEAVLQNETTSPLNEELINVLVQQKEALRPLLGELKQCQTSKQNGIENQLRSYVHMLLNRISVAKPRLQELVVYDFLFRHYRSMVARNKK